MTTEIETDPGKKAKAAIEWLGLVKVGNLPIENYHLDGSGNISCPTCHASILGNNLADLFDPTYDEITKLRTWTVAQLIAWRDLQARSGINIRELLARTTDGNGEYVGVSDFHSMFIGIEKDGYTHS